MDLDDLKTFLAVVHEGSFTAAAEKLFLSKQFVSRRIALLEKHLGVSLVLRNSRKVRITDIGHELAGHARRILNDVAAAEHAMQERRHDVRGALKINAPLSFGARYLSPLIAEFLLRYPDVHVEIDTSGPYEDLIGGDFDVAIRVGQLPDSTLVVRSLGVFRSVACCSPKYADLRGQPGVPAELREHDCLIYGQEPRSVWIFQSEDGRQAIEVQGPLRASSGEFIHDAAVAGRGIALLPYYVVEATLRQGLLVPILQKYAPPPTPINMVYPQHRHGSRILKAFLDFIKDRFRVLDHDAA